MPNRSQARSQARSADSATNLEFAVFCCSVLMFAFPIGLMFAFPATDKGSSGPSSFAPAPKRPPQSGGGSVTAADYPGLASEVADLHRKLDHTMNMLDYLSNKLQGVQDNATESFKVLNTTIQQSVQDVVSNTRDQIKTAMIQFVFVAGMSLILKLFNAFYCKYANSWPVISLLVIWWIPNSIFGYKTFFLPVVIMRIPTEVAWAKIWRAGRYMWDKFTTAPETVHSTDMLQ